MPRAMAFIVLAVISMRAVCAEHCQPRQEYDTFTATVTEKFYDKTFRGLDWPSRIAYYRSLIRCDDTEHTVAVRVNALLAELRASHTALYTRTDFDYWGLNSFFSPAVTAYSLHFPGIWPERRQGHWHAKYVLEHSPAARAGVSQGDRLLQLNGQEFSPVAFSSQANTLILSSDGKTQRTVSIQGSYLSVMQGLVDASNASRKTLSVHGKRIGYFHLWAARDTILKSLEDSLAEFDAARVDALILDLRGGYGGTSPTYLARLRSSAHLMRVPKFFLIDDGVRSGKEMLAAIIEKEKLGTLVGSRTAGAFLGAVPIRLFDDRYFLLVAAYGGNIPELPPIEGVGVSPDVAIDACRVFCSGFDPQLAKALELASS